MRYKHPPAGIKNKLSQSGTKNGTKANKSVDISLANHVLSINLVERTDCSTRNERGENKTNQSAARESSRITWIRS